MTQSTLTKPETATAYDPYEIDTSSLESMTFAEDATSASGQPEPQYKLLIDENVVEKISSLAAQKVEGIIDMKGNVLSMIQEGLGGNDRKKGVDADVVDESNAKVELSIILEYGKSATDVFDQLKNVKDMTGLNVIEMTVNVVDVMDEEEFNQKRGNGNDDSHDGSGAAGN